MLKKLSLSHVQLSRHLRFKLHSLVCQQVVFETGRTPVATHFTLIVNANNLVLIERTIWQVSEAELAIFFINLYSRRFVFSLPSTVIAL